MIKEADEETIRKYLLGELAEEQQVRLEESLMTDDDFFKLLEVIEDELIDECLGGELSSEEQQRFDTYFLSTPERREKFMFAQTLREYVSSARAEESKLAEVHRPALRRQPFSSPYLRLAAAAVIVIGLVVIVWLILTPRSEVSKGMAALKSAYREQRPTQSRITGFDYARSPVTRGGEQEKFDRVARDHAGALIQEEVSQRHDAHSYHDLGRLYLARHEFDKAIEQFEEALNLDKKNAELRADLGAAYLERASAGRDNPDTSDLSKSLEQLKQAIEIDDSLLAAYFNKALCLQRMNELISAKEAWEDYLKKDPDSEWSKEAEINLRSL